MLIFSHKSLSLPDIPTLSGYAAAIVSKTKSSQKTSDSGIALMPELPFESFWSFKGNANFASFFLLHV